ncbi:MAG: prepilin-type N-terminal cleavage/methylation domain-containing protein [Candidatus Omnitrophota bacterium]
MKIKNKQKGLTLIEMLLAAAMSVIVSVTVYVMISNGLKVWQIVNQETSQIDMTLFLDWLEMDLKNCIYFQGIDFTGGEHNLNFPGVINIPVSPGEVSQRIGQITYFYDQNKGAINRQFFSYQNLFSEQSNKKKSNPRILLEGLTSLLFEYNFYDQEKKSFFWIDSWPPKDEKQKNTKYPLAVRLTFNINEGQTMTKHSKIIELAVGGEIY